MIGLATPFSNAPGWTRRRVISWAAVLLVGLALGAVAHEARAQGLANLSQAEKADLSRIEVYLNRIKTMKSRFLQVSSDGEYSEGDLYFSKPGKMRIVYDDPTPILIVADGAYLAFYEKELEQVSYYDLEDTTASLLLRENISFSSGDIIVTAFDRGPGVLRLTIIKGDAPLEGNLTLIFSDRPLDLKKWSITDAQGVVTDVSLLGPRYDVPLKADLFRIELPNTAPN